MGVQLHVTAPPFTSYPGQCLAHYIMGSGFIAYAVLITITMLAGEHWMQRSGRSPDFFDSCVIMLWVCLHSSPYKLPEPNSM